MENESTCKRRTLKIIDTSFLNVGENLFIIVTLRFILLQELFQLESLYYFAIGSTKN